MIKPSVNHRPILLTNVLLFFALILSACAAPAASPTPIPPTQTLLPPTATQTAPLPTASLVPTETPLPAPDLCSPLDGIPLAQLAGMISNPYHPPVAGSDDPHQGVDFAITLPDSQVAVAGHTVNNILAGVVAAINPERFPYGRAVLVETPLSDLPAEWLAALAPEPDPAPPAPISLSCPAGVDPVWDAGSRSLYILYAHLEDTADLQPETRVTCGQILGTLGMSGNALNPHLHVEIRVGPAGLRFSSMAHYDASASLEEMAAYCAWRVGGRFQLVDPLTLLALAE